MGGKYLGYFISAGAAISAIGALNGWILITSYMPMTMANDNLFPKIFLGRGISFFSFFILMRGFSAKYSESVSGSSSLFINELLAPFSKSRLTK